MGECLEGTFLQRLNKIKEEDVIAILLSVF